MDTNGEVTEAPQAVEKPVEEKPTGTSVPHGIIMTQQEF